MRSAETKTIFDDFPDKDGLRRSLVKEQRGLCCYCLSTILADPLLMKIEPFRKRPFLIGQRRDFGPVILRAAFFAATLAFAFALAFGFGVTALSAISNPKISARS